MCSIFRRRRERLHWGRLLRVKCWGCCDSVGRRLRLRLRHDSGALQRGSHGDDQGQISSFGFFYPFHFLKINSRSSQLQGFISKVLEIPSCCLTDTHLIATAQTGIITKPSGNPSRRNYLNIQAVNICGRAKGLGFNDAKMATKAGAVSATICCELEKTIIMLLFCTTKSD